MFVSVCGFYRPAERLKQMYKFFLRFSLQLRNKILLLHHQNITELWCNGNTTDSGPVIPGSNPGSSTRKKRATSLKISRVALVFLWSDTSYGIRCFGLPANTGGVSIPPFRFADRSLRSAANRSERASAAGGCGPRGLRDRQRQRYFIPHTTFTMHRQTLGLSILMQKS